MKEFIKKNLAVLIVASAGFLALLFCLFLPGASFRIKESGEVSSINVATIGLMFGRSVEVTKVEGIKATIIYHGGLSIFGLFSFLCFIASIGLLITSLFVKDKKLDFAGCIVLIVAGFFLFFLLTVGTNITAVTTAGKKLSCNHSFTEIYETLNLGAGAYISAFIAIISGGLGIASKYFKIVRK